MRFTSSAFEEKVASFMGPNMNRIALLCYIPQNEGCQYMCKTNIYIKYMLKQKQPPATSERERYVLYTYIHVCIWLRLRNIGLVTGPGGLLATRLVTESGGLATNPHRDKPIEDYSTLHRGPRQGFVAEGPRQRYVTEGGGGGTATNPYFQSQPGICRLPAKELLTTIRRSGPTASQPEE